MLEMSVTEVKNTKVATEAQIAALLRNLEDTTGAHVETVIVSHSSGIISEPGLRTVRINLSL
jgi:hypothetical protein